MVKTSNKTPATNTEASNIKKAAPSKKIATKKNVKDEPDVSLSITTDTPTTDTVTKSEASLTNVKTMPAENIGFDAVIAQQSLDFSTKLQQVSSILSTLKNDYKALEKKFVRELKLMQKLNSKKKRKVGNRAPSGFVKPTKISEELSNFLEMPLGAEMARTEVTREINKYIRSNNLQDKVNGRKIIPDEKLATLLKITDSDELTYFNLQRYMSPHFEKSVKAILAASALTIEIPAAAALSGGRL